MNGVPPWAKTVSMFSTLKYALSAETSPMENPSAVLFTSGLNCGQSAASRSRISTAVTTWRKHVGRQWSLSQIGMEHWFNETLDWPPEAALDVEGAQLDRLREIAGRHRLLRVEPGEHLREQEPELVDVAPVGRGRTAL